MKSKVSIDVDFDNQPIIKIEYEESTDVRDKLVKKFLESFGGDSTWASFQFENGPFSKVVNKIATIRPLTPSDLKWQHENMKILSDRFEEYIKEPEQKIEDSK